MDTAKSQDSGRFWGLKQGTDDYLTKPFTWEKRLHSIGRLL